MGKLFLFGCSYTAEYEEEHGPYKEYKKFRGGNFPPTWGQLLSQKLNLELVNYATGGIGNDEIFQRVCKHSGEFKNGDVVIIGWTYMHRFRFTHPQHLDWLRLSTHFTNPELISEETNTDISISRTHPVYLEQLYDFENMIESLSKSTGFKLYFWSSDFKIIYTDSKRKTQKKYIASDYIQNGETIFNEVFRRNGERLLEETNGVVNDLHFGETAHKILSELFHEHINNKY